jgi:hypothetical protein
MLEQLAPGAAVVPAHHEDRHLDTGFPKLDALLDQRHTHARSAGALERARDRLRAVSVGIRLEHAPDRHLRHAAQALQVVPQVTERDLGPRGADAVGGLGSARGEDARPI